MPRGDRTGPVGSGPMTGRSMGYCSGSQRPGSWYPGAGFGYGWGRGLGLGRARGWRHSGRFGGYPAPCAPPYYPHERAGISPKREKDYLKEESDILKKELEQIEKRLNELEGEKE